MSSEVNGICIEMGSPKEVPVQMCPLGSCKPTADTVSSAANAPRINCADNHYGQLVSNWQYRAYLVGREKKH